MENACVHEAAAGEDEQNRTEPKAREFAMLHIDEDFLYLFGGRWTVPNFLWLFDLRQNEWSKWKVMEWHSEEFLQWNNVASCPIKNEGGKGDGFVMLFALCKNWDVYDVCMKQLTVRKPAKLKKLRCCEEPTTFNNFSLNELDVAECNNGEIPAMQLVFAGTTPEDGYFMARDDRHFYFVPNQFCRPGTAAADLSPCQGPHIQEFAFNEASQKWEWSASSKIPCPHDAVEYNDDTIGKIEITKTLKEMDNGQLFSFVYQSNENDQKYIGIFAGASQPDDEDAGEKQHSSETTSALNNYYFPGTTSQKIMLVYSFTENKYALRNVHSDPLNGYPSYRTGAAFDVFQNKFFLIGGLQQNVYLPIGQQNHVLNDIWRLNISEMTWNKLERNLNIPVCNSSVKLSTDGTRIYIFGGSKLNKGKLQVSDDLQIINI